MATAAGPLVAEGDAASTDAASTDAASGGADDADDALPDDADLPDFALPELLDEGAAGCALAVGFTVAAGVGLPAVGAPFTGVAGDGRAPFLPDEGVGAAAVLVAALVALTGASAAGRFEAFDAGGVFGVAGEALPDFAPAFECLAAGFFERPGSALLAVFFAPAVTGLAVVLAVALLEARLDAGAGVLPACGGNLTAPVAVALPLVSVRTAAEDCLGAVLETERFAGCLANSVPVPFVLRVAAWATAPTTLLQS